MKTTRKNKAPDEKVIGVWMPCDLVRLIQWERYKTGHSIKRIVNTRLAQSYKDHPGVLMEESAASA